MQHAIDRFRLAFQYYAKLISGSQLTALESGGHFVFMPLCNVRGYNCAHEVCADIGAVDGEATHQRVAEMALKFFDEHLR